MCWDPLLKASIGVFPLPVALIFFTCSFLHVKGTTSIPLISECKYMSRNIAGTEGMEEWMNYIRNEV